MKTILTMTTVFAILLFLFAGCDISMLADMADDNPSQSLSVSSEKQILSVLQSAVKADMEQANPSEDTADEADETVQADDSPDEQDYPQVSTEQVQISPESVVEDVTTSEEDASEDGNSIVNGKLVGKFFNDIDDSTSYTSPGKFRGKWFDSEDNLKGYLKGTYHPVSADKLPNGVTEGGIFEGQFIDENGNFKGILRGRYGRRNNGKGLFVGYWLDREHHRIGILKGHWRDEPDTNGGIFAGRWAKLNLCIEVNSLPPFEFDEDDVGGYQPTDEQLTERDVSTNIPSIVLNLEIPECIDVNNDEQHHGLLCGRYIPRPTTEPNAVRVGGKFRGKWFTAESSVKGILIGDYRPIKEQSEPTDENDSETGTIKGVFYGKYVDSNGNFHGYLRGVYGVSVHGAGVFRGEYISANLEKRGVLFGRWTLRPLNRPGGLFAGFWHGQEIEQSEDVE